MIQSLQIGRGLAALAVVLFHNSAMFGDPRYGYPQPFRPFVSHGYLGVDFFFVLSGFIILFAHRNDIGKPIRLLKYMSKRIIRIYPMYLLFTAFALGGALAFGGVTRLPDGFGNLATMLTLIRFTEYETPIATAWTLFNEMAFYALFATLLIDRRLGMVVLALWFGVIAVQFHYPPFGAWSFANCLLSANNLSFLVGICAFWGSSRLNRKAALPCAALGAALFALTLGMEAQVGHFDGLQFGYSLAFGLGMAGTVAMERFGKGLNARALCLLGDASYVLYLCHENVGSLMMKILMKTKLLAQINHELVFLGIVAATIVFAIIVHRLIERPLLDWLRIRSDAMVMRLNNIPRRSPDAPSG
ncbi:MAG TPA: acyltransferase [Sphingobium sp.]|uniref:acyltransferase family protein n=1 Tax=Sphingobium sp. TaxID=1912891 RepID=UPI002ED05762